MDSSYNIVLTSSCSKSWADTIWFDAKSRGAIVHLDYCCSMPHWMRKLRQIHFSNKLNRRFWQPLKDLWDWSNIIKPKDLDPAKRNYIIFQTGVKFSPNSLLKLKKQCNARIVLYMPDTFHTIGIADNREQLKRFLDYYHIDDVYSFDPKDCEEYGVRFFDYYSVLPDDQIPSVYLKKSILTFKDGRSRKKVLYIGNARTTERLKKAHEVYKQLRSQCDCTFILNGVNKEDQVYDDIFYNHSLTYPEVIALVKQNDAIVEIMNGTQTGNTLRGKEAICYNKQLITNNVQMLRSPYYDPKHMLYFQQPSEIDTTKLSTEAPKYNYQGEFSPKKLLEMIVEND